VQQRLKHRVPANVPWQLLSIFPGAALSSFDIDGEWEINDAMNLERLLLRPPKLHGRAGAPPTDGDSMTLGCCSWTLASRQACVRLRRAPA
jgi:hypothetical protein